MKLWHDDVRPAPEGWVWAKTNAEAMEHLATGEVEEISMDHDLGANPQGDPLDLYLKGESREEDGYGLACWMADKGFIPEVIKIHSWNPPGAQRMAAVLRAAGCAPIVKPYVVP